MFLEKWKLDYANVSGKKNIRNFLNSAAFIFSVINGNTYNKICHRDLVKTANILDVEGYNRYSRHYVFLSFFYRNN